MHLRALPANDVPDDFTSLTDVMRTSWEAHPVEVAAGIADSIAKDFGHIDRLYTGARCRDESAGTRICCRFAAVARYTTRPESILPC